MGRKIISLAKLKVMKRDWILVDISDHPQLPLKRKVNAWAYKPDGDAQIVEVFLIIQHYLKNEDGTYGDRVNDKAVLDYEDKLTAANIRVIDPVDGMELNQTIQNQGTEEEIIIYTRIDNNEEVASPIGQFDFFDYIIKFVPVKNGEMIQKFIVLNDVVKKRWG